MLRRYLQVLVLPLALSGCGFLHRVRPGELILAPAVAQRAALMRLEPGCAALLVGSETGPGNIVALSLSPAVRPPCLLTAEEIAGVRHGDTLVRVLDPGFIRYRVLEDLGRPFQLIRVDQNAGGTKTLVSFAAVTVYSNGPAAPVVMLREVLPDSITRDDAALAYGRARRYPAH